MLERKIKTNLKKNIRKREMKNTKIDIHIKIHIHTHARTQLQDNYLSLDSSNGSEKATKSYIYLLRLMHHPR